MCGMLMTATVEAVERTRSAAEAASDKLASDLIAIDVSDQLVVTDVFLICSANNERQVGAVVDAIEERLLREGVKPLRREGLKENHWVLLDYGDLVVHVFLREDRMHYAIERLWKDCPEVSLA